MGGKVEAPYFQFAPLAHRVRRRREPSEYNKALSVPTHPHVLLLAWKIYRRYPTAAKIFENEDLLRATQRPKLFADNAILCVYSTVERAGETRA